MPYIKKEDRIALDMRDPENAGELNYLFTVIALRYLKNHGYRYQRMNDIMGALEGCKLEIYRRHFGPYEDTKIAENGDVTVQ